MMDRRDFLKASTLALAPIAVPGRWLPAPAAPIKTPDDTLFPTGIRPLDEALGGGIPSGLCLVTGHCGSGKTALLRRIHKAGLSRHVAVHVKNARTPIICPLTGMKHYRPECLYHEWLDRPVALIDDVQDVAPYTIELRQRLFLDFLFRLSGRRPFTLDPETYIPTRGVLTRYGPKPPVQPAQLSVVTWPTVRKAISKNLAPYIVKSRPHFAYYWSGVVLRVDQLDIRGRGRIEVVKNRRTGFHGNLTI